MPQPCSGVTGFPLTCRVIALHDADSELRSQRLAEYTRKYEELAALEEKEYLERLPELQVRGAKIGRNREAVSYRSSPLTAAILCPRLHRQGSRCHASFSTHFTCSVQAAYSQDWEQKVREYNANFGGAQAKLQ